MNRGPGSVSLDPHPHLTPPTPTHTKIMRSTDKENLWRICASLGKLGAAFSDAYIWQQELMQCLTSTTETVNVLFYLRDYDRFCGVCCYNAWGRVRNTKPNPEAPRPIGRGISRTVGTSPRALTIPPNKSVLITIITWHFQFHLINVSILHLNYEYDALSENRFACYPDCYITWCPFMTGIVAS